MGQEEGDIHTEANSHANTVFIFWLCSAFLPRWWLIATCAMCGADVATASITFTSCLQRWCEAKQWAVFTRCWGKGSAARWGQIDIYETDRQTDYVGCVVVYAAVSSAAALLATHIASKTHTQKKKHLTSRLLFFFFALLSHGSNSLARRHLADHKASSLNHWPLKGSLHSSLRQNFIISSKIFPSVTIWKISKGSTGKYADISGLWSGPAYLHPPGIWSSVATTFPQENILEKKKKINKEKNRAEWLRSHWFVATHLRK